MMNLSVEALRIFCKALVKSLIPMATCYVAEVTRILRSVGADRTGKEDW